jgi:hypothetical protein
LFGSKVTKEVFNFPKGGKHIEKTRTNKKGDVVSRMSKDTKVNPLAFFNKNKEQANKKAGGAITAYKKSLKKAQAGIQTNGDPEDMMINKPGSTGGYKKSLPKYKPWEGPVELIDPAKQALRKKIYAIDSADPYGILNQTNSITPEMANKVYEGPRSVRKIQGKGIRQSADTLQKVEKQKKGGSVKRKK